MSEMRDAIKRKLTPCPSSTLSTLFLQTGLTFWERHEALTAANPPTSEGACVLIALNWTVKEPSWYLGEMMKKKKRSTMNGIHQEECKKNKKEHITKKWIENVKLWELEWNAFAAY